MEKDRNAEFLSFSMHGMQPDAGRPTRTSISLMTSSERQNLFVIMMSFALSVMLASAKF